MTLRIRSLAACLLLSSLVAACGDDAPLPPPEVDGGAVVDANFDATIDATTRDDARADLGDCIDDDGTGERRRLRRHQRVRDRHAVQRGARYLREHDWQLCVHLHRWLRRTGDWQRHQRVHGRHRRLRP